MSSAYLVAHYAVSPVHFYGSSELLGWAVLRYEHSVHEVVVVYAPSCELLARQLCAEFNEHLASEIYTPNL